MYVDETPILESVFVDLAPNADFIQTIVFWDDNDDCFADWVWCALSYRELEELTADMANYDAARIWYGDYWPWTN